MTKMTKSSSRPSVASAERILSIEGATGRAALHAQSRTEDQLKHREPDEKICESNAHSSQPDPMIG